MARPFEITSFYWDLFHTKFISQKLLDQMLDCKIQKEYGIGYGFGIMDFRMDINNQTMYGHFGNMYGYTGAVFYIPSLEIVFAYAVNLDQALIMNNVIDTMNIFL